MPKAAKKPAVRRSAGRTSAARPALGKLPEWNLGDLYAGLALKENGELRLAALRLP